jgi:glucosamine kinase
MSDRDKQPGYFCLDIGGSGTRGALFANNGDEMGRAQGPGGALSLGVENAHTAIMTVWRDICAELNMDPNRSRTIALWAGIAGKSLSARTEQLVSRLVVSRLGGFSKARFVGDGYGALLAATGGKPGGLISVGTGVTALFMNGSGAVLALGGWGFPAGDKGGGAWMGLQLVGALCQHMDGVSMDPPFPAQLAENIFAITGPTPRHLQQWQTEASPGQFGALAPLVVEMAKENEAFCQQVLDRAALEIVALARALVSKPPDLQHPPLIHLSGGLGPILLPRCQKQAPDLQWAAPEIDPVNGIYLLASGQAPDENPLPRPFFLDQS